MGNKTLNFLNLVSSAKCIFEPEMFVCFGLVAVPSLWEMKSALSQLIMVRIAQGNLQRKRTATLNLSRLMQEGKASIALIQEPYFHKGDFYSGKLLNPAFVAYNRSGMRNPRIMPRACILANTAIHACFLS